MKELKKIMHEIVKNVVEATTHTVTDTAVLY